MARRPRAQGDNSVGHMIYMARQERRMTQADLAEVVGCSRSWIAALEKADKSASMSLDMAQRLTTALGLPLGELLFPDPPERPVAPSLVDMGKLTGEIAELAALILRLRSTSSDLRIVKDLLRSLHRNRQEESTKGGDPPTGSTAP